MKYRNAILYILHNCMLYRRSSTNLCLTLDLRQQFPWLNVQIDNAQSHSSNRYKLLYATYNNIENLKMSFCRFVHFVSWSVSLLIFISWLCIFTPRLKVMMKFPCCELTSHQRMLFVISTPRFFLRTMRIFSGLLKRMGSFF